MEYLKKFRGLLQIIRVNNGPEFISHRFEAWCKENRIQLLFIRLGKPMQNVYANRCNGSIRRELLNAFVFRTLAEIRQKAEEWVFNYNHHWPHKAYYFKAPAELF
ncbi:integrase core domain-containing protein [Adhaeribacter aquaticus]|uniref:integrase core domain-containing protein n=1 Tax=Adhaeribacter aquaticus TaxID=299567 RepID=UPI0008FEDA87|nr:integrase core domain-containing protein [Adhaeribacter aquaticus]